MGSESDVRDQLVWRTWKTIATRHLDVDFTVGMVTAARAFITAWERGPNRVSWSYTRWHAQRFTRADSAALLLLLEDERFTYGVEDAGRRAAPKRGSRG